MKDTLPKNLIFASVAALVIGAGGGFFAGTIYQQNQQSSNFRQFAGNFQGGNGQGMMNSGNRTQTGRGIGTNGANVGSNRMMGNRPVSGEIISSDDKSITVKMQDGSSKIVLLSTTTSINKASAATKTDLTTGTTVAVFGQTNSDGSIIAQSIQLNPEFRGQEVNGGQNGQPGTNQPIQPVNGQGALPPQGQ